MISGFETGTIEYTAASGLTVQTTNTWVSPRNAYITSGGYVYWDVSEGADGTQVCFSFNIRIESTTHMRATITRGGESYTIEIADTTGDMHKEIRLYGPSGYSSGMTIMGLTPGAWANVVVMVAHRVFACFINNRQIHSTNTSWASSVGTITRVRIDAYDSAIRVDDVCTWQGGYSSKLAIVQPFLPWVDRHKELDSNVDFSNCESVNEIPSDNDTSYVYNVNSTKYDLYGCRMNAAPPGMELIQVIGMRTMIKCRATADTGDEVCYVGIMANGSETPVWSASKDLSTSWQFWDDYWTNAGDEGPLRPSWFENLDANSMQLGVQMTCGSGETALCTTLMAQVLCFYARATHPSSAIVLTGCFDVTFDMNTVGWSNNESVAFYTNVMGIPIGAVDNGNDPQIAVVFYYQTVYPSGVYVKLSTYPTSNIFTETAMITSGLGNLHIRMTLHDNYCTISNGDAHVYTFAMRDVNYPDQLELYAVTNRTSQTITNVLVSELADWREGIYIDMETSIMSGISSIIQERPVEILPLQGGIVDFSYNRARQNISPVNIIKHSKQDATVSSAGSHYIVYYSDVAMLVDETFMDESGYLSRMLQMSQLDSGAVNAAKVIAQRARESQERHSVQLSPDIRIEPGDKATIAYTLSGTGTVVSDEVVVEQVQLSIEEGIYNMQLGGRKYV